MIFKDRREAAKKLVEALLEDEEIKKSRKDLVVMSLVRGGAPVGEVVSEKLGCPHRPLVVKKIGAPHNEELAIGAICNKSKVLDQGLVSTLNLSKKEIKKQVKKAKEKQKSYLKKFVSQEVNLKDKTVVLVDDGIATGASVSAALRCLRQRKPKKVILAVPVAPTDFEGKGFDKVFILHKDPYFSAVSQFYRRFEQVTDKQARKMF